MKTSTTFKATAGVLAALTVAGVAAWIYQLMGGLGVTGMNNGTSWGLYITMFMFFVGLSAGGLIISSIPRAFGMQGFGGISKVAVWTSICCTVLAIGFVVVDLGQPLRVWELFAYSNLGSPLMWDIVVLFVYLILSAVYLWATLRAEAGKVSQRALRAVSVVALVCAVLVHSVTAWIFGLQQAHEFWHTAILAPWFVSSALVCGTALVLVVAIALRRAGYLSLDQSYVVKLVKMLGAFVVVDLYFFGCDLLTAGFPGGSGAEVVGMLVSGPLAPFFWTEVAGCALAAVVCFVYVVLIRRDRLIPKREAPKYLGAVCETAGQFAYIYAIADTEHLAMSAPIISSYCAASVLWSRLFLKEKLSWKHYAMIALVVIGIAIMGVFDL